MSSWMESRQVRRRGRWDRISKRRGNKETRPPEIGMPLSAVDVRVTADPRLMSPTMRVAVIEDLCWAIADADWQDRKPPFWRRRAYRDWKAEQAALDDKRARVAALVASANG